MLTPGLITPPPAVEVDPPRRGFSGDMPVPIDPLGPLAAPGFFLIVAVLGTGRPAVDGAELNVCDGEEKWIDDPEPISPELSCLRAFSCRAWTDRKSVVSG